MDLPPVTPNFAACEAQLVHYAGWREEPDQQWSFTTTSADGASIFLFGAKHSRDPSSFQFPAIAAAFASQRPTVVFYEGPDRGLAANADEVIRTQGESGYVRFLAGRAGLKAVSLEPPPTELLATLRGRFDADSVMLFFVLQEAARLRDREQLSGAALDEAVAALLKRAIPLAQKAGLRTSIIDLESLSAASRQHWPAIDWDKLPSDWFAPGQGPDEAKFLPAINTAVSEARDLHMFRRFMAATAGSGRVFVVVGRNHVPMIAPALECAFKRRPG